MEQTFIAGLVLVALSGLLHYLSKRALGRAALMATTDTKRIADIQELVAQVRRELPGDEASGYAEFCELKGKLVSDEPVRGELSGEEVGIYHAEVLRVIETRRERRNDDGSVSVSWHKSNETLSSNRREATLHLDDGSGRLCVLTAGAEMELDKVVDRFEPPAAVERTSGQGLSLAVGSFSLNLSGSHRGSQRRTLGYRFTEKVLPLNKPVYALGEVADTSDGLVLRKPNASSDPFVVSLKSETELIASKQSAAKWLKYGALASIIAGSALVVMGLLK